MATALTIRADFDATVVVPFDAHRWVASPEAGVERMMLDRIGDEVAVATSLVRYRPGSRFAAHRHDLGEEFLVLEGTFADEKGRYPAGCYVRNPPGSTHSPRSDEGCLIFVKLRQFAEDDDRQVVIDTTQLGGEAPNGGTLAHELHRFGAERVCVIDGDANAAVRLGGDDAMQEVLVVSGTIEVFGERLTRLAWLRAAAGQTMEIRFVEPGRLFTKTRPRLTDA